MNKNALVLTVFLLAGTLLFTLVATAPTVYAQQQGPIENCEDCFEKYLTQEEIDQFITNFPSLEVFCERIKGETQNTEEWNTLLGHIGVSEINMIRLINCLVEAGWIFHA